MNELTKCLWALLIAILGLGIWALPLLVVGVALNAVLHYYKPRWFDD